MAFRTSRTFTSRRRPPRLAGGIIGSINAHSASVRSLGYRRPLRPAIRRCSAVHMWCPPQINGTTYRITTDSSDSTTFWIGSYQLPDIFSFRVDSADENQELIASRLIDYYFYMKSECERKNVPEI